MSNVFFPKKSHHGYFDQQFQRTFYDKKQKQNYMKKHGIVEGDGASKAHMKRVKDFVYYCENEKKRNPNFRPKDDYPN